MFDLITWLTFNVKYFRSREVHLEPGGTILRFRSPYVIARLSLCCDRGPPNNATGQLLECL